MRTRAAMPRRASPYATLVLAPPGPIRDPLGSTLTSGSLLKCSTKHGRSLGPPSGNQSIARPSTPATVVNVPHSCTASSSAAAGYSADSPTRTVTNTPTAIAQSAGIRKRRMAVLLNGRFQRTTPSPLEESHRTAPLLVCSVSRLAPFSQAEPVDAWTGGPVDRWTGGPVGRWAGGSVDRWAGGSRASVTLYQSLKLISRI